MTRYQDDDDDWEDDKDQLESSAGEDYEEDEDHVGDASRSNTLIGELEEPRPANYSGQTLYRMMMEDDIDLDPDYQRAVVWSEAAQSKIIESWIKRFHVPEILFRVIAHRDGERRVCIDGKQRLTSLRKFFDGEIPYIDEKTGKRYYYKMRAVHQSRKVKPLELSIALKKRMENKQIRCEEYHHITEAQERMLFERVQRGMTLTPAEKLRAHNSPWSKYLNSVLQEQVHDTSLSELISFNPARNAEFLALVRLCFIMVHGLDLPRPPTDAALSTWLSKKGRPTDFFKEQLRKTMDIFNYIATSKDLCSKAFCSSKELKPPKGAVSKASRPRYSPVEWVLTALLIARHTKETPQKLADAIRNFREELNRFHFGEKKFNGKVFDRFRSWEFSEFGEATPSPRKRKRKGEETDDDSDDLYEERDVLPASQGVVSVKEVKKTVRKFSSSRPRSSGSISTPTPAKRHKANGEGLIQLIPPIPSSSFVGHSMDWVTVTTPPMGLEGVDFGQPNDLLMK
ncbi:uncharacterized protein EI90DRAFT_1315573 [Cantharellus anzutake]|uniref:uncharacterized protein n=1 Tax=Cantharellus anzutake TaxID=1750568 RepID=UPI0019075739|nr:uncharacterized protein EI90DRAFT_1315573 [Cantharellus anzutake]KAF8342216.1 hypothetical protein EI90DRAFT_1315573 [Cantharellus anzutake]